MTSALFGRVLLVCMAAVVAAAPGMRAAPASATGTGVVSAKPHCQPGDRPDTGLEGQVPLADRLSGRSDLGYNCNLKLIGGYGQIGVSGAFNSFDTYKTCAYYQDGPGGNGGTVVVDVSDPMHPVKTDYLTSAAMYAPWESLKVNNARGLLVADRNQSPAFDVYDISGDCRHPKLLTSEPMPVAQGHEGWFAPDGRTYFMSATSSNPPYVSPIDLTDPTHPKELANWNFGSSVHGGSISEDGSRVLLCQTGGIATPATNNFDYLTIADVSQIQNRVGNQAPVLGKVNIPDNAACQATWPVTYGGKKYAILFGELTTGSAGSRCLQNKVTNYSLPHIIDISDEQHPKIVSDLMLEVDDPANCSQVAGDGMATDWEGLFVYDTHMCRPDRLHDPTILACNKMLSGLRVFDIRNPFHPQEIAYYNMGTSMPKTRSDAFGQWRIDAANAPPVIRTELGQIWFTTEDTGLHVAQFENGVWPFAGSPRCPNPPEYFFNQYNPGTDCSGGVAGSSASLTAAAGSGVPLPFSAADGHRWPWLVILLIGSGFGIGLVALIAARRRAA